MRRSAMILLGLGLLAIGARPGLASPDRAASPEAHAHRRATLQRDLSPWSDRARWAVAESFAEESDPNSMPPSLLSFPHVAAPWTGETVARPRASARDGHPERSRPLRC